MKIYIPSVLTGADCKHFTEIFSIVPFISNTDTYKQITEVAGYWNDGLFSKLFLNGLDNVERVTEIIYADIVVIPFKYHPDDERVIKICDDARSYNKQAIAFYNDDNGGQFVLPDNLFLFRTSAFKSTITPSERILPVLIPDHKPGYLQLDKYKTNNLIAFCGHIEGVRGQIVEKMMMLGDRFKPIIRQGFWAPGVGKVQARREFYQNMRECSYTLCMRGGGNFSYRFYEALSFGRIPILIDTDMVLPFEEKIDWDKHLLRFTPDELISLSVGELKSAISGHYKVSPNGNRLLWERFFSPEGYMNNLLPDEITYLLHTES